MTSAENTQDDTQKVIDIINDTKIGMFSTLDEHAAIVSRPLVALQVEDDGGLWFITHESTSQVAHVGGNNTVNVTFGNRSEWVAVTGTAEVVTDTAKTRELWNPMVDAWFPDGPETPGVVLIRVDPDSAEYWDTPGGAIATAFKWAKSRIRDDRIDAGESRTVEL